MRTGCASMSMLFCLIGSPGVQAQGSTTWVEPDHQRITVVGNTDERRQVRFTSGWETADYVVFEWRDLRGEMVYLTADDDRVSIELPLTAGEVPRLFRSGSLGEVKLGRSGRGPFLLGTAFGQRFTVAGSPLSCFTFLSTDQQRALYGYACAPAEPSRAEIEDFLRNVRLVNGGFVEDDVTQASATDTEAARQFALGRDDQGVSRGLTEVPLGYAVLNSDSGG